MKEDKTEKFDEPRQAIAAEMNSRFGRGSEIKFFQAPGRVDLMGSHTDYNQGYILATTVNRKIVAGARLRESGFNFYSLNTREEVRVPVGKLVFASEHGWANYPKGVLWELQKVGFKVPGLDLVVWGNIPVGGNLSSSAALEAVTCEAVLGVMGASLPPWDKVKLCQRAENDFLGMPCGIMDQFTVIMGGERKTLELDCRSLEFHTIAFPSEQAELAVIDSGLGRALVASKYADRVKECQAAVQILARQNPKVKSLRDATLEEIERAKKELGDVLYRRARHVVTENQRVLAAGEALRQGDLPRLGQLMEEGYQSSKNDYENSLPELDLLHDLVSQQPGVLGVRICGAGWGGCLLALLAKDQGEAFENNLAEKYRAQTNRDLRVYLVLPAAGAGPLEGT